MDLGGSLGHLTYSTLVHPGDTWEEMWHSLTTYVPAVKERVCPDRPFGVSLRLSGKSAERLTADAKERARLKAFLADNDMYLYTVNAFPHGQFKGVRVKEQVYEPDWRTDQRALYTMQVADILAEVAAQTQSLKLVVGFAAETHDVEKYARGKLVDKRLDLVIANQVGISGGGFESDNNAATAFWQDGEQVFPATSKRELAEQLLALIARRLQA